MEFLANDVHFSCLMLYTKFQDTWNLHISLHISRNLNYCTVPSSLDFRDWLTPVWPHRNGALKPCSQIHCLFLSSPEKKEPHCFSDHSRSFSNLYFSSNYLLLQVCGLSYLYYYGPTSYQLHRLRCLRNCI